jgi:hypothetical protein
LLKLARSVVLQARHVGQDLQAGRLRVVGSTISGLAQEGLLRHYIPLVEKGIAQTRERVFLLNDVRIRRPHRR